MKGLEQIDVNNIILNENAYFYKFKSKKRFTKDEITSFFSDSIRDKSATRVYKSKIREPFLIGSKAIPNTFISLDIFKFQTKPSFLEEPENEKWETKFGLFLIVEHNEYIAIIKRNVSGVKNLFTEIEQIDYEVLTHFLITNKSKYEKIVSNTMNTAENAIQRKVSESVDLKGVLSRFGASKQILNSIRLDNEGTKHTVAINTSRINSFQLKNKFENVISWLIEIIDLIINAYSSLPQSSFLDGFAAPLKFENVINDLNPTYVLLRFGSLKEEIENNLIEKSFKKNEKGDEIKIDLMNIIKQYSELFKLTKSKEKLFKNEDLKVKVNEFSISILCKEFQEIILDYGDGFTTTLNQYINNGSHFLINFDKIDHVYANRKIFKDSKLLGDLENFFTTFITFSELTLINSEKGQKAYIPSDSVFQIDSLFGFIENKLALNSNILICDDMGVEWGDFISISDDEVAFYHAKYNEDALSASNLEVVFGQAQKNLGTLELTEEMIEYRKSRWLEPYKINKVITKINRIRKIPPSADKIQTIKDYVNLVSSNPNLRRKVFIVVNFLSKKELITSIEKLKDGKIFDHQGVTLQILWFVNSLLCSSNELNTEFRIICKE